ncbi:MAG TPA: hypothetical protein VNQ77_01030 [Frankiaceae bacterium]|nr:hypothetical protein [Frankiaceae bacterium]
MRTRLLLAAATLAAAAGTAAPASAYLCATVYVPKDSPTAFCVPYGSPLPEVGCPVRVPDLVSVCD